MTITPRRPPSAQISLSACLIGPTARFLPRRAIRQPRATSATRRSAEKHPPKNTSRTRKRRRDQTNPARGGESACLLVRDSVMSVCVVVTSQIPER
eukprot:5977781-Pyramimonas_sp.AAC.1